MPLKINDAELTAEGCDWGVEYTDPTIGSWVFEAEDESEARQVQLAAIIFVLWAAPWKR